MLINEIILLYTTKNKLNIEYRLSLSVCVIFNLRLTYKLLFLFFFKKNKMSDNKCDNEKYINLMSCFFFFLYMLE